MPAQFRRQNLFISAFIIDISRATWPSSLRYAVSLLRRDITPLGRVLPQVVCHDHKCSWYHGRAGRSICTVQMDLRNAAGRAGGVGPTSASETEALAMDRWISRIIKLDLGELGVVAYLPTHTHILCTKYSHTHTPTRFVATAISLAPSLVPEWPSSRYVQATPPTNARGTLGGIGYILNEA